MKTQKIEKIQIFEHEKFGKIRTAVVEGNPMFVAVDAARALGYRNPAEAVATHCKSGDIAKHYVVYVPHYNGVGGTNLIVISESNLYRLIMRSNQPIAIDFQDWVCDEVLPTIRKTGGYILIKNGDTPEAIEQRLKGIFEYTIFRLEEDNRHLIKENEILNKKIEEGITLYQEKEKEVTFLDGRVKNAIKWYKDNNPKIELYNKIMVDGQFINVGETAKILNLPFGRNTLFKELRERGIFFKDRNEPKQKYINDGYFSLKKVWVENTQSTKLQVVVSEKGTKFINDLFSNNK